MGELRADCIGRECPLPPPPPYLLYRYVRQRVTDSWNARWLLSDPVTSLTLSPISPTLLVSTLDSHVRLFDRKSGKMLGDFTGHKNDSYKSQAAMMYGEGGVVCGDEDGKLWSWGVLDVSSFKSAPSYRSLLTDSLIVCRPNLWRPARSSDMIGSSPGSRPIRQPKTRCSLRAQVRPHILSFDPERVSLTTRFVSAPLTDGTVKIWKR